MVGGTADVPICHIEWQNASRIVRSIYPPIDLFEDIAAPEDWPQLIAAEQKTNPRLMETIGNIDLVPAHRRVSGPGASYLMAPFTHTSRDRPSRFSDGRLGVLYVAANFETAVHETAFHHAEFMRSTKQQSGWTSQFRELVLSVEAMLHDVREIGPEKSDILHPHDYSISQHFAAQLRAQSSEGLVYPSVRGEGDCVALFYPDLARDPMQGRHLNYHWDGHKVDLVRDIGTGDVFRLV